MTFKTIFYYNCFLFVIKFVIILVSSFDHSSSIGRFIQINYDPSFICIFVLSFIHEIFVDLFLFHPFLIHYFYFLLIMEMSELYLFSHFHTTNSWTNYLSFINMMLFQILETDGFTLIFIYIIIGLNLAF